LVVSANSGIGLAAAKLLAVMNPLHRIVLACRNQERADYARKQILPLLPFDENSDNSFYTDNIIAVACDHSSMESIQACNTMLRTRLNETYNSNKWIYNGIDVLCLNAAVLVAEDSDAQFTEDGVEVTFQTNYLAAFQLVCLMQDLLTPGSRIILSTSGLHERVPKLNLNGMVADPITVKARKGFEMPDGSPFHYKRSYAVSKLCLVALCAELEGRLRNVNNSSRGTTVNCFSPGLMTRSGLFRNQRYVGNSLENMHSAQILAKEKTVSWGAGALVYMALADETGKRSGEYWRDADSVLGWNSVYGQHFSPVSIVNEIDVETRERLWRLSNQLVGVPCHDK
jgi:protochlorophyllide reductase